MANTCSNIAKINFRGRMDSEAFEKFKKYFVDVIVYEMFELDFIDEEDFSMCEITYGTTWHSHQDGLQEVSDLFNCNIIGVSWEFGNDYVDSFEIWPNDAELLDKEIN